MTPIRQAYRKLARASMGVAVALAAIACAADAQSALPESHLGRWYYAGSSGGISGQGMGDEATGYIVIDADGTITHFQEDGTLVGTTEYEAELGETIFSVEPRWILRAGPIEEAMWVSDDGQQMTLNENVYDGFSRGYVRSR